MLGAARPGPRCRIVVFMTKCQVKGCENDAVGERVAVVDRGPVHAEVKLKLCETCTGDLDSGNPPSEVEF